MRRLRIAVRRGSLGRLFAAIPLRQDSREARVYERRRHALGGRSAAEYGRRLSPAGG